MFSKRLDFIIKLTGVKVNKLAKASNITPSYISKLRTGDRQLPSNPSFLNDMCIYFVKNLKTDEQKHILARTLNISIPINKLHSFNEIEAAALLQTWLLHDGGGMNSISMLVDNILAETTHAAYDISPRPDKNIGIKDYYYGDTGKKEVALKLFDVVLSQNIPVTLYLNSEENMSWMKNDMEFIEIWQKKLIEIISRGNKIVVIHNIKRNLDEMFYAVSKWTKIYLNGAIEAYYYPGIRDNVFQRSIFIAEDVIALSSISVSHDSTDMLNHIVKDKRAVSALTKEFKNHLKLCKPLSIFVNKVNLSVLLNFIISIENKNLSLSALSSLPTLFTMPRHVAESIQKRYPTSRILEFQTILQQHFENIISTSTYTEIIPSIDDLLSTERLFPIAFGDFCNVKDMCYTNDELEEHYKYLEQLNSKFPNYNVNFSKIKLKPQLLFSLDYMGFMLARPTGSNMVSVFMEDNIINAYNEFLKTRIDNLI